MHNLLSVQISVVNYDLLKNIAYEKKYDLLHNVYASFWYVITKMKNFFNTYNLNHRLTDDVVNTTEYCFQYFLLLYS